MEEGVFRWQIINLEIFELHCFLGFFWGGGRGGIEVADHKFGNF